MKKIIPLVVVALIIAPAFVGIAESNAADTGVKPSVVLVHGARAVDTCCRRLRTHGRRRRRPVHQAERLPVVLRERSASHSSHRSGIFPAPNSVQRIPAAIGSGCMEDNSILVPSWYY